MTGAVEAWVTGCERVWLWVPALKGFHYVWLVNGKICLKEPK